MLSKSFERISIIKTFSLLCTAITITYANSLNNPWIFDDKPNILDNQLLHLTNLSFHSITQTFFAHPELPGKLFRPLSCLSFALNWYVGQDNVSYFHLVNICIHILVSLFLYLCCIQLLSTPATTNRYSPQSKHLIALVTAVMWSLNPVQTQAVTYIVQRMAALATLFSIIGIYFFLKARLSSVNNQRIIFLILCVFCFFCALASKENAIIFPISLIVIEYIFFDSFNQLALFSKKQKMLFFFLAGSAMMVFFLFAIYYIQPYLNYSHRTFTLSERLFTEPKILLLYLSFLLFPIASRLSIEHDVVLSTSLFTPLDTFPAICTTLILLGLALVLSKKKPLLSLALIFFFINHIVESTILPLELIFEHRNYLPSLFIFLPVASLLVTTTQKYRYNSLQLISPLIIAILVTILGFNTYTRNKIWAQELTLWEDAHAKAPHNSRAASNLAKEYIDENRLDEALELLKESSRHPQPSKNYSEAISLNGQGVISNKQGKGTEAIELFKKSLEYLPDYAEAKSNLILSLIKLNRLEEALALFRPTDSSLRDISSRGNVLLRLNKPLEALNLFRSVPSKDILSVEIMQGIGKALSMLGHYEQADFFLRNTALFTIPGAMSQIENLIHAGEKAQADIAIKHMLSTYPAQSILDYLTNDNPLNFPLDRQTLFPLVMLQANEIVISGKIQ